MTKEEAIARIKDHMIIHKMDEPKAIFISEALDMAIKALEQEPCKDADTISRQAAIDAICKACSAEVDYHNCDGYPETSTWCDELVALRALPSVTPQPKVGHWIPMFPPNDERDDQKCSCCGYEYPGATRFCSDCGAKMVEPQESDHKCHNCKHYTSGEHDGSCGSYICKHYSNWESEDER